MILDEAPAGLDVRSESEFYQLLYQLKREQGWAILQISHDLDMVRRLSRSLSQSPVLCQGIPEVALSPDNLSAAYGTEFVRYRHSLISVQILVPLPFALCRSHQNTHSCYRTLQLPSCSGRWSVAS